MLAQALQERSLKNTNSLTRKDGDSKESNSSRCITCALKNMCQEVCLSGGLLKFIQADRRQGRRLVPLQGSAGGEVRSQWKLGIRAVETGRMGRLEGYIHRCHP